MALPLLALARVGARLASQMATKGGAEKLIKDQIKSEILELIPGGSEVSNLVNSAKGLKRVTKVAQRATNAVRLERNISARVSRIEEAGNENNATREFRELQAGPQPTTLREIEARDTKLKKLDSRMGTRARTAARASSRDETINRNRDIMSRSNDPNTLSNLTDEEADIALRGHTRSAKSAITRTRKALSREQERIDELNKSITDDKDKIPDIDRDTEAIRRAEELLYGARPSTRNEKIAQINNLRKSKTNAGMNPKGAIKINEMENDYFGQQFNDLTSKERGAIWDQIGRYAEKWGVDYRVVLEYLKKTVNAGLYQSGGTAGFVFSEKDVPGREGKVTTLENFIDRDSSAAAKVLYNETIRDRLNTFISEGEADREREKPTAAQRTERDEAVAKIMDSIRLSKSPKPKSF